MARISTAAAIIAVIIALLCISVPDQGTSQAFVHPTVTQLRLRKGIPHQLADRNVVRTVSTHETLRVLRSSNGISESAVPNHWLFVENAATGEQGWIASWYSERVPLETAPMPRRPVGIVIFSRILARYRTLAAVINGTHEFGFASNLASLLSCLIGIVGFWWTFRHAHSGVNRRATATVNSVSTTFKSHDQASAYPAAGSCFYGSSAGKPWAIRRRQASN
jgi:hypothetical protein